MIYASAAIKKHVTETFKRSIKKKGDAECIRLKKGVARTLAASRYIQLPAAEECKEQRDDCRRLSSQAIKEGAIKAGPKLQSWQNFVLSLTGLDKQKTGRVVFAQQQSRLLINMAGGVFENGGLNLDRLSGLPVIPGSAVKGCARRLALASLQEWTSGQLQPGDVMNVLNTALEGFSVPLDLLYEIALIFGWSDLQWKSTDQGQGSEKRDEVNDFAWACGRQWPEMRASLVTLLLKYLNITPQGKEVSEPWKCLPAYAGSVVFLPAYPWERDPGIELDVITCHHSEYYKGTPEYAKAPDTEEPVPVIFPAIAAGQVWAFLLNSTTRTADTQLQQACRWLSLSLETFGIGAKTGAGYGWFDASASIGEDIFTRLVTNQQKTEKEAQSRAEEVERRQQEEKHRLARAEEALATAEMTSEQKVEWKVAQLTPAQFSTKLQSFHKGPKKGGPSDEEKAAIIRMLRGTKLETWSEFKLKASKGELATAASAIRSLNKQLFGDKMP